MTKRNMARRVKWMSGAVIAAVLAGCGGGDQLDAAAPTASERAVEVPIPSMARADLPPVPASTPLSEPAGDAAPSDESAASAGPMRHIMAGKAAALAASQAAALAQAEAQAAASGAVLYVASNGNDAWSGGLAAPNATGTDGPLRSLPAAQARARAVLAAMAGSGNRQPLRVRIQPGTYVLTSTLNFTTADSGTPLAPVSYEATVPGSVVISGAVPLSLRSAASGASPALFGTPAGFTGWEAGSQLFINGRRAVLARTPNAGQYWFVQKAIPLASEAAGAQGRLAFGASSDALSLVAGLSAADRSRAIVNVMHAWTSSQHRLASVAPSGGVQLASPALWTFLSSGTSQRYWIENVASALDAPGEFFVDAAGVRYLPRSDEAGATLNAAMPLLEQLVTISGDVARAKWVDSLQFRGLTFAHTRTQMPSGGFSDWQAATSVGAAVEVDAASNIVFDGCKFTGTGGYGVWLRRAVRSSSVTNSSFDDLGAGGIKIGMVSPWSGDAVQTGANAASNNLVGNTGKLYPGAVGIWVGRSFDNTISNNLVYNTSYSGISIGWSWDFGDATAGGMTVTDNLLVNIGQGQLADLAGIYTVGVSPQTRISGNVVREVRSYPGHGAGAWGLYGDTGTSQVSFSENVVVGADSGGFQLTASRGNSVQNNLFAWGEAGELNVAQPDPLTALSFTGNLLMPKTDKPFMANAKAPYTSFAGNEVSSSYAGKLLDLSMCGTGCSSSSAVVSAGPEPRNITISGASGTMASRAAQVIAKAGPTTLANAGSVVMASMLKPQVAVAPAMTFELDIANAAIGTQPLGFWYSAKGNIPVTGVVANTAAPNGRCLQYTDSAANANGYDPHSYAPLNHVSGTTTGEFDLLIDANTYFVHQWRDGGSPAKTGPALEVKSSGVYVNGVVVAPATVGRWMKFKISAPLAGRGTGWTLQVVDGSGNVTTRSGLPFVHSGWASLNWWGFISNAKVTTNLCLASVRATNVQ